jgi:hypothetical protein
MNKSQQRMIEISSLDFTVSLYLIEQPIGKLNKGLSSTPLSRHRKKLGIEVEKVLAEERRKNRRN